MQKKAKKKVKPKVKAKHKPILAKKTAKNTQIKPKKRVVKEKPEQTMENAFRKGIQKKVELVGADKVDEILDERNKKIETAETEEDKHYLGNVKTDESEDDDDQYV
jgi:hypothetical protein